MACFSHLFAALVAASALLAFGTSAQYVLVDDYAPGTFFDNFNFFTDADPTHGSVIYESPDAAGLKPNDPSNALIGQIDNRSTVINVDWTNTAPNGRRSVRISSKKTYNKGLLLVDVQHMPTGCGTWPALWMLGDGEWPYNGEIDILEGANDQQVNYMTLHTGDNCAIPPTTNSPTGYTGTLSTQNCFVNATDQNKNAGCSIQAPVPQTINYANEPAGAIVPTYGESLNAARGGTLAMEWTSSGIRIWFFGRNQVKNASINAGIRMPLDRAAMPSLNPGTWGKPMAQFAGSGCDFDEHFQNLSIVINTAFCGDWASHTWDQGCAAKTGEATCEAFVANNPAAFKEAYWQFGAFRWFESQATDKGSRGRFTI